MPLASSIGKKLKIEFGTKQYSITSKCFPSGEKKSPRQLPSTSNLMNWSSRQDPGGSRSVFHAFSWVGVRVVILFLLLGSVNPLPWLMSTQLIHSQLTGWPRGGTGSGIPSFSLIEWRTVSLWVGFTFFDSDLVSSSYFLGHRMFSSL